MSTNPFIIPSGGAPGWQGGLPGLGSMGASNFASPGGAAAAGAGVGGAAGAAGGNWLMPALGILLNVLGAVGGKKAQGPLAMHKAIGGLAGALLNNPFEQNTTDKDKDKPIDGKNNNLAALGILGQQPFGVATNFFES